MKLKMILITASLVLLSAGQVSALEKIDIFLIVGQSNAVGQGSSADSVVPSANTVYQYYNGSISQGNDPVGNASTGSAWPAFGKKYNELTGRKVLLVPSAVGGTGLSQYADSGYGYWSTSSTLYQNSVSNLNQAIKAARIAGYQPVLKGILWAQGENDAVNISGGTNISQDTEEDLLKDLIRAYRKKYRRDLPFYIFQTGTETRLRADGTRLGDDVPGYMLVRSAQENVAADDIYTDIVFDSAFSFAEKGMLYDGIHYSQAALNEMGAAGASNVFASQIGALTVSRNVISARAGTNITFAAYSDFDQDAKADILFRTNNGQAILWIMDNKTFVQQNVLGPEHGSDWYVKAVGDMDGNGTHDLVWQNSNGDVKIGLVGGGVFVEDKSVTESAGAGWNIVGAADFNKDGKDDILWQNANGQAMIWKMNGSQVLGTNMVGGANGASFVIKGIGDFNGDGNQDFIWRGILPDGAAYSMIYFLNGDQVSSAKSLFPAVPLPWDIKGVGDFNDDGKDDILWQNANGQATVWTMNGESLLNARLIGTYNGPTWNVKFLGDMDDNGKMDFAWQNDKGVIMISKPLGY